MKESLLLVVFLLALIIPGVSYAQEEALILSPQESASIFSSLQRGITEQWIALDIEAPEKQLAVLLLRDIARNKYLAFFPGFISTEIIKVVINAAGIVKRISEITIKDLLTEIESKTVEEATRIATNWLLQNQVKTSSGDLEYTLTSYKGNQQNIEFQYLITYDSIDDKYGSVAIELFSPTEFEPPSATASIVLGRPWDIGTWLRKGETKIHPFILESQAKTLKAGSTYSLDSQNGNIDIKLTFPEKVPRLQLAKEWPYPLEEQKIKLLNYWTTAKKILEYLRSTGSETLGKAADFAHKIQEATKGFADYASRFISQGGADLVDPLSKESQQIDFIGSQLHLVEKALEDKEDQTKLSLVKDKASSVENLDSLSFPRAEPAEARQEILELKGALIQIKDEIEQEEVLKQASIAKLRQSKDEAQSVDNLVELSLERDSIEETLDQTKFDLVQEEQKLSPTKDEQKLSSVKDIIWCDIDPNRGPGLSTVMFYEIAWMGSANSANDEWIKLKNISNSEVNLAGWQVQDADSQIKIAFEKAHVVSSQNTLILERTNDDSLLGIQANFIYTGALNNSNEALYLFDEKCVLRDKVVASPDWLAGDAASKKPMVRSNDLSWYSQGSNNSTSLPLTNALPSTANVYTAGSPPPIIYPRILISEVQTAGANSQIEEFVELYNPMQGQANLTDWYIQKKTQGAGSFATFASKNILSGKTIQAGGYFLVAREGSSFASSADAVTSYSLGDNNVLALKNPNGEITDKVGWGDVQDAENAPAQNPQAGHSLNRIWDAASQTYYDRDNNSIDFVLHNPASPKAQNVQGAPPPPPPPPPPATDTTSPEVTLGSLAVSQTNTSFSLSWSATDSGGEASPSGVQSIFLEYTVTPSATGVFAQYNNNGVWTNWQAGSAGKVTLNAQAASLSIRGQDGVSYTFQVSASDVAGNSSTPVSASTAVALSKTVVINEIAWMGTTASATDEWIELYNTTSNPINLAGWTLAADDSTPSIQLAGTIDAGAYFLLERTADTTISDVLASQIYTGALANEGEYLKLFDASGNLVDSVDAAADWFNGDNATKQSMERISVSQSGSSASNWAKNNIIQHNGKDAGTAMYYGTPGNFINGTPKQANSTIVSPTTIDDQDLRFSEFNTIALTNLGSPYISAVHMTIPASKTLVIEPGVTVKFPDNQKLTVQGTLKAQGTQAQNITFTVREGSAIWCGIRVESTSTASQLDYVVVDKAGGANCNPGVYASMYVDSSAVVTNNSTIQTGAGYRKLYLKNSNSIINATTISGATLNADSVGIYIDGGSPTISNSTISNNSIGIFVNSLASSPTIQNNTFTGNTQAVKLSSAGVLLSGNTATNNTYNGIYFEGAVLSNMTWQADTMPYIINKFTVSAGTTLTIQAGVVVKFINSPYTDSAITVQGTLITQGTQANPVVFTAAADDTVGGSNSYTGGGIKTSWERIYIAPGSTGSQLMYTTLKYGGNTYYEAALYVKQSSVQVSNLTISNSGQSAIYSFDGTITGSDVILSGNTYGFHIQTGDCPVLSNVTVTGTLLHPSSSLCSF